MSDSVQPPPPEPQPPVGPTPARVRPTVAQAIALALSAATLAWHGYLAVAVFPPGPRGQTLPFTEFDHPFHFYYANLTRDFFQKRGAFWGYDPTFMAGYAKTLIFPTSSTLPELVAIAAGPSAQVYRSVVAAAVWITALLMGGAVRTVTGSWIGFAVGVCISVVWIWCGFPSAYAVWGMAPYIVATAASVWGATLLASWLDSPRTALLASGTAIAALATILHPSSAVILATMLWPAYLVSVRQLTWRRHLIAWSVPLVVLLAVSPWWYPAWQLRELFGTTASGFVNENIAQRMWELLRGRFPTQTATLMVAPFAALYLRGTGRAIRSSLVAAAIQFFIIAYFASALPAAWFLQPGRYDQPLYAVLILIVAAGWTRCAATIRSAGLTSHRVAFGLLAATTALSLTLTIPLVILWFRSRPVPVSNSLPAHVQQLAHALARLDLASGRVLFEDRGRSELDAFWRTNPSAILPLLAPGQYIGGPYLHTHLKTNATQCGDGKMFDRTLDQIDNERFYRWVRQYNLRWAVFWSPQFLRFASVHPGAMRLIARFGPLHLYEFVHESNWAATGYAQVTARPDRLDVRDARPGPDGTLVLSYHWVSTLRSNVAIRPIVLRDDPVPFIAVDDPPEQFVIENRMW